MKTLCDTCNGKRVVNVPGMLMKLMGHEFTTSDKVEVCPRCSKVEVRATRRDAFTNAESQVVATLEYVVNHPFHDFDFPVIRISDGGVTGYESFFLKEETIYDVTQYGWLACAGTKGRWDRLFISAPEMGEALNLLGVS